MMFRRQALRHLEEAEALDEVARLTTVPSWLLTLALAVTVVTAGAWSAMATVEREVLAAGVLIHSNGVSGFDAVESGRVVKVWISPTQRVAKGTPLYSVQGGNGRITTTPAPWDAYVVSLLINEGQLVQPGTRVAELERLDAPDNALQAVLFVPADTAPLIQPGIPVEVIADAVPSNVFGTLHGTVGSVGAFPETEESLKTFLGSGRDVRPLLAAGSVVRVVVPLATDPSSPNGLKWSKAAPPFRLNSVSDISGRFVIDHARPIDWVLGQ